MKQFIRAFGMVPEDGGTREKWLCLWNNRRKCFEFISAEPMAADTFREQIHQQVCADLGLSDQQLLTASMAQLNLETSEVLPGETQPCHLAIAFYLTELYGPDAKSRIQRVPNHRWLNHRELIGGTSDDGLDVDPVLVHLLRRTEVIQPW
ncbi:MAG: hypothetical protein P8N76_07225 [Pirellulaceae bacterium]|nr:hypothetical protein [Pirellulaceae bacterium]